MSSFTRRSAIALGLSAGTAALLSACATPGSVSANTKPTIAPAASGEKITLTYWAWLKDLQKICDIWNAQHPNVQVEAVWTPGGNAGGYQKMYAALAAGGGPDLAQVELRSIPEFMLVNGLVDLSRYGAKQYADRYDQTLWNQVSYLDGVYGIPQDSGPMGLYYRPDLLSKAGVDVPKTWEEWADAAAQLRGIGSYIDCFPLSDAAWFCSLACQAGASWLKPDSAGWTINLTDPATLQVAEFFDRVIDQDLMTTAYAPYSAPWFAAVGSGQLASLIGASWGDALLEGVSGAAGKWRVAALPRWGDAGFGSSYNGGSTAAVFANSKHPKEALEFAVWMTTSKEGIDAMINNSGIGWSPAVDYLGAARQKPSEFFGGQNYNQEIFSPASKEQNPAWSWWPLTQQTFEIISDGFRKKANGVSLVSSLKQSEQNVMAAFRNKGLTIRKVNS
ncbi:ABC transporter substrate-binding protein [Psychromicrobium sp. YIM B11713]|uniref:ABC transporter substrate-binding protein n=1 Tax=Psychromicrobium sp. YIM B11713 TaxID=3145233 RepID=UPI00374ED83A